LGLIYVGEMNEHREGEKNWRDGKGYDCCIRLWLAKLDKKRIIDDGLGMDGVWDPFFIFLFFQQTLKTGSGLDGGIDFTHASE
jgi:hypothetical protein